jgi:hypothetical protein
LVTYTHALYTPALNANLISISSFDKAGLTATFSHGKGIICKPNGTVILASKNVNKMYILETIDNVQDVPLAMGSLLTPMQIIDDTQNIPLAIRLLSKPTSMEQWHQRLTHCSLLTIQDMETNNLVNELKVT